MEHNLTIKTYMAIMAERDAAIQDRNMALDERRRAFAERDMAMLQRDAAIAERNSAMEERDKALSALQYRESSMNEDNMPPESPETGTVHEAKHLYHQQHHQMNPIPDQSADTGYDPREIPTTNPFPSTGVTCETSKSKKAKQAKETVGSSTKKSRSPKKAKGGPESASQVTVAISNGWNYEQDLGVDEEEDPDGQLVMWKDNPGLNQISFDESTMPVPVCSCTGAPQPCYKWGNGGWQSACCTTTVSMYPLPQTSNKRHARVGGRKMSGSVFTKLLNRLAAEGYDLYSPLDLKDHWAKHGTNRYSTLK